jgi:hypothetical protein
MFFKSDKTIIAVLASAFYAKSVTAAPPVKCTTGAVDSFDHFVSSGPCLSAAVQLLGQHVKFQGRNEVVVIQGSESSTSNRCTVSWESQDRTKQLTFTAKEIYTYLEELVGQCTAGEYITTDDPQRRVAKLTVNNALPKRDAEEKDEEASLTEASEFLKEKRYALCLL